MTVKPLNLTLYLVLNPDLCSQSVGIVETALAAVQAGAGIVQLRAPTWKKRRMTECARALKSALTPFHVPLIIDDHADVMSLRMPRSARWSAGSDAGQMPGR